MKKWDLIYFDTGEYKFDVLASFTKEDEAYKALDFAKNNEDYADLGWVDFDVKVGSMFDSFEDFLND